MDVIIDKKKQKKLNLFSNSHPQRYVKNIRYLLRNIQNKLLVLVNFAIIQFLHINSQNSLKMNCLLARENRFKIIIKKGLSSLGYNVVFLVKKNCIKTSKFILVFFGKCNIKSITGWVHKLVCVGL